MQSHMTRLWGLQHLDKLITGYHEVYFVMTHHTPKFVWLKVYVINNGVLEDITLFMAAITNSKVHQLHGGLEYLQDGTDAGEMLCKVLARAVNPAELIRPKLKPVRLV